MTLRHQSENFVNASWRLVDLRDLIYNAIGLLFTELKDKGGMAGDDGAGRAFATVYKPAVQAVFDQAGYAHVVMASGAGVLLRSAENFLKNDSRVAADLLGQSPEAPGIGPQPSGPDCTARASHQAEDLPGVVGETSWTDQYLLSQRFHGAADKLRAVAGTWRSAGRLLGDVYWDAEAAWKKATLNQAGETADAAENFFKKFVGKQAPPSVMSAKTTRSSRICPPRASCSPTPVRHTRITSRLLSAASRRRRIRFWANPSRSGTEPSSAVKATTAVCTSWSPETHVSPNSATYPTHWTVPGSR
ncbi:hypothetical protein [Streptomyces sulphureus]|uniref:hypothetical protein n=1 Tax=Streptomyces sulphureus TaxID=47758 RepID=UPI00039E25F4|nr:hypothetical protein [Streptomyces sulphureus]